MRIWIDVGFGSLVNLKKYSKDSQEMKVTTMLKIAFALGVKAEELVKDLEIYAF